jgi:hypothetical protein
MMQKTPPIERSRNLSRVIHEIIHQYVILFSLFRAYYLKNISLLHLRFPRLTPLEQWLSIFVHSRSIHPARAATRNRFSCCTIVASNPAQSLTNSMPPPMVAWTDRRVSMPTLSFEANGNDLLFGLLTLLQCLKTPVCPSPTISLFSLQLSR